MTNLNTKERIIAKMEIMRFLEYEKRITEFKEKLLTSTFDDISIYVLPYADPTLTNELVSLGIKSLRDLCYYDLTDLNSKVSKDTFNETLMFMDTVDKFVSSGIIEGY